MLTREEVARLLGTFRDGRYRAFSTLLYQCGFRLSEALSIRPKDIDGHWLGYSRENASKLCTTHHRAVRNVLIGNYSLYWALYTE